MRSSDMDPGRHDELRDLLRSGAPEPPMDEVDWAALHGRITARAGQILRRPAHPSWWQLLADGTSRSIPAAGMAAAALLVVLVTGVVPSAPVAPAAPAVLTLEEELAAGSAPFLATGTDPDAVLGALLFHDDDPDDDLED